MDEIHISVTNPDILNYLEIYKKFYNRGTYGDAQIIEEILLNHISQQKKILDGYDSLMPSSFVDVSVGHDKVIANNICFKLNENTDELHINK